MDDIPNYVKWNLIVRNGCPKDQVMAFVKPLGKPILEGNFDHWGSDSRNYSLDEDSSNDPLDALYSKTKEGIRETLKGAVLLYYFDVGGYSTEAFILYVKDGKFYSVRGSHCSCYGYEDQWDPEETKPEHERNFLRNAWVNGEEGNPGYLVKMWKVLDNFCPPEAMPDDWGV